MRTDFKAGQILAFDKPLHWTSFQLVGKVRWLLCRAIGEKRLKVGHAGTLDPLATGLMVVCTGKATKNIEELQRGEKEYLATLRLGATTPSYDLEHEVDQTFPTAHITAEKIAEALCKFRGEIDQVPPVFSACKVDGKRAYDLARKGKDVELQAKRVTIHELELRSFDAETMSLELRVRCSKGTYIRALARDIGEALQSGAHLTALRRTRVGDYTVENAFPTIEAFEEWLAAEADGGTDGADGGTMEGNCRTTEKTCGETEKICRGNEKFCGENAGFRGRTETPCRTTGKNCHTEEKNERQI